MQISGWKQEKIAILVFIILAGITGLISGYWPGSFLLWSLIYIIWKFVELNTFYNWYLNGASNKSVPNNHGVFKDITCQVINNKNNTKETQKRNKHLLQQFITTAQVLPFGILLLNNKFEIQWVNSTGQDILDINEMDVATKIDNIIRVPGFIDMMHSGDPDQEIKLPHSKDKDKSIQLRLIKINKERFLLVARDISAQEGLQKSRKAFIANASHELRTPLTVISGYLEMLQASEGMSKEWSVAIDQSKDQANRMSKIIDDMLKLSKIEHDRMIESEDIEIPMPKLINGLFNDIKQSEGSSKHQLEAEINSSLWLKGDTSEVTSICLNLMHNAIIHTPKNTRITVKWFVLNDEANFWVIDDGPGIDANHLPHLTERFYRVDNSRAYNHQSTGLGLAIVKHICLKHSARFEIQSNQEQGSTFKVIFPERRSLIKK